MITAIIKHVFFSYLNDRSRVILNAIRLFRLKSQPLNQVADDLLEVRDKNLLAGDVDIPAIGPRAAGALFTMKESLIFYDRGKV